MTHLELADAMGIHETSLSQMDRGTRGVGTQQIIRDLQGAQGLAGRVGQPCGWPSWWRHRDRLV